MAAMSMTGMGRASVAEAGVPLEVAEERGDERRELGGVECVKGGAEAVCRSDADGLRRRLEARRDLGKIVAEGARRGGERDEGGRGGGQGIG